jgi:methyl-accepting chemotaxis protein
VDSVGRISESTIQLKVSSSDLQDTVNAHTNSFKILNRSLNKQVLPAHEAFLAAISQFNGRAEGLLEQLDDLHGDVMESIGQITSLAPSAAEAIAGFSASSAAFSDAVRNRFAPAAEEHRENTDKLAASVDKLRKSTQGLADGETAAGDLVRLQTRLSEELGTVQESLRLAVDRLAETGTHLNQSLLDDVAPSQRSLREAAGSVSDSAARLSVFVQKGVDPATKRLYRLDETLQRLTGTVDAIRDFSGARQDIEHLSQSLSRASAVSDAIAALPEQIREVLEEVARTHQKQVDSQSRGGMMGWLRGRR